MNILSQIQARENPVDDLDIFSSTYKEKETEFKEDPLVLAVSLKELWSRTGEYISMEDLRVLENITDDIRERAEAVRKYFTKKFFWQNLKNSNHLSDYRRRVCYLLENHVRTCKDQDIGIYFKLPWFYEEDIVYEDLKKQYSTTDLPRIVYGNKAPKDTLKLTYLKTSFSYQRKRKVERFWFTNGKYLYSMEIESTNPLIYMLKDKLESASEHTLNTFITQDRIDQMHYYKLFQFTFAKE